MTDSWEIVRQRPERKRRGARLYVSLNRRGEIAMNANAYQSIGQPATVALLVDPKTNRIGVKFPVAIDRHFFPVRRIGRGRKTLVVRAERMLKQFGIKIPATQVFRNVQCVRFEGSPMLLMSFDDTDAIVTQRDQSSPRVTFTIS